MIKRWSSEIAASSSRSFIAIEGTIEILQNAISFAALRTKSCHSNLIKRPSLEKMRILKALRTWSICKESSALYVRRIWVSGSWNRMSKFFVGRYRMIWAKFGWERSSEPQCSNNMKHPSVDFVIIWGLCRLVCSPEDVKQSDLCFSFPLYLAQWEIMLSDLCTTSLVLFQNEHLDLAS